MILFTASDLIHPQLASEIKRLTDKDDFDYDVIEVPFKRYILGIEDKRSPWKSGYASMVFRKNILKINNDRVHDALNLDTEKRYKLKGPKDQCIYHLTHETVDSMMNRHLRYWRAEAQFAGNETLKKAFYSVLYAIKTIIINRKSFLLGWKGVMLGFAFITYYMMSFVYKWEKKYSTAEKTYTDIRKQIHNDWANHKK